MLRKSAVNVAQSPCPNNARGACVTLAQSRCHELTVTDIYIYIHTNSRRHEHRDYLPRLSARQLLLLLLLLCHQAPFYVTYFHTNLYSRLIFCLYKQSHLACCIQLMKIYRSKRLVLLNISLLRPAQITILYSSLQSACCNHLALVRCIHGTYIMSWPILTSSCHFILLFRL